MMIESKEILNKLSLILLISSNNTGNIRIIG